jgi:hypothetical protein
MEKRSIPRLILLDICTLGFYELAWLAYTRDEMVQKFGVIIPKSLFLVLTWSAQIIGFIGLIVIVLVVIPASNHRIDTKVRPSPECFYSYTTSSDAVRAGEPAIVSPDCRKTVDNYFSSNAGDHGVEFSIAYILGYFLLLLFLPWLVLRKWLLPYCVAVEQVTHGALSASRCLLLLGLAPPIVAMCALQNTFNKIPLVSPDGFEPPSAP